jgi:hypothetical protein
MQADRLHVVVRPRGILECLDLAVILCGRRPAAVAVAVALGAAPFIVFNLFVVAPALETTTQRMGGVLLLGIETAWASVPLTLYLGQAVFSERFSWRLAARALVGSFPALVLFQGIIRGICLGFVVLAPVVFIGMYYLDQIILLERPRLSRIWNRRTAINRRNAGHILALALVDGLLLIIGVPLATQFLAGVTAVWQGRAVSWIPVVGPGGLGGVPLFSWHGQIAFWAVCGLVTVFRFFTYLDARIRREGWDVELALRSAATYAGLPTAAATTPRPAGRGRPTAVAVGIALMLMVAGAATAAGPPGVESGGDNARQALARQSFPWYDADHDRYRPRVRPRPPERRPTAASDGSASWISPEASTVAMRIAIVATLVAMLAVVFEILWSGRGRLRRTEATRGEEATIGHLDDDRQAALPAETRLTADELLSRATDHADRGEYERAIVFFHAWQLVELDRRGGLALARGKTNGHYMAEVAAAAPTLDTLFRRSSRLFEDAFFGGLPVRRADFLAVWHERARITAFSGTGGRPVAWPAAAIGFLLVATAGCGRTVDTTYASVRGPSLNGVAAFVQLLRDTGHAVTARQTLPARIAPDVGTLVVFDGSVAKLEPEGADLLSRFVFAGPPRTLLLVLPDGDCTITYFRDALAGDDLTAAQREEAGRLLREAVSTAVWASSRARAATDPFPDGLVPVDRGPGDAAGAPLELTLSEREGRPERRVVARWELLRRLVPDEGAQTLWAAGEDRLLVRWRRRDATILVLASATPLLNGSLVDPGNRQLAEDVATLLPTGSRLLLAGSTFVDDAGDDSAAEDEEPSLWRLLGIQPLPWVAVHAVAAVAVFCWSTAPIFGRPRRTSPVHAQDFGHHVEALATLFERSAAAGAAFARERLDTWRPAAESSIPTRHHAARRGARHATPGTDP